MPWYPGQVTIGQKVEASVFGMARGFWSQPPSVVSIGTTAPGVTPGTVTNSTGYDCMVYMSTTTGIGRVLLNGSTVTATQVANSVLSVYVPTAQTLAVTYTGVMTWIWLAV